MKEAYPFPSVDWLNALIEVLNADERYAAVAQNWEGDMVITIEPDPDQVDERLPMTFYLDLWHGKCRSARSVDLAVEDIPGAKFVMSAPLGHILRIFTGELDPMQAMLTRKLQVTGNLGYMLRNVPTVLDFVRCCRLVPIAE